MVVVVGVCRLKGYLKFFDSGLIFSVVICCCCKIVVKNLNKIYFCLCSIFKFVNVFFNDV